MPRAIEIYVDEKQKAVLINTNYGNREVKGASWEPITFRLGWDDRASIAHAARATVSEFHCSSISLVDEFDIAIASVVLLSSQQEMIIEAFASRANRGSI